jgi:transposase-like protein
VLYRRAAPACARVGHGERKAALAREFGISRETLYQYLRQNSGRTARARLNGKGDKYRSGEVFRLCGLEKLAALSSIREVPGHNGNRQFYN